MPGTTTDDRIENLDNEEDEESNCRNFQVDDVIAIKSTSHGFRIGKVHRVDAMNLHVHLYFYQLDDKNSEIVFERDLLINFGRIGTKKKLQLGDEHQKQLLEKLFWIESDGSSLLQIIGDSKRKDYAIEQLESEIAKLSHMEASVQQLLQSIIIDQTHDALVKTICENNIMSSKQLLDFLFDHLHQIQCEKKLKTLSRSISTVYIKEKSLRDVTRKFEELTPADPFYDMKKKIIKAIAAEIGESITNQNLNAEFQLLLDYAKLSTLLLKNEL